MRDSSGVVIYLHLRNYLKNMKQYLKKFMLGLVLVTAFAGVPMYHSHADEVKKGLESIKDSFPETTVISKDAAPKEFAKKIIDYALYFAALIAVFFVIYGGYLYIFSAGSDEKAKTGRKTLVNALIGLIIITLSYAIVQIVYAFITTSP
jgi:predicted permease